LHRAITSRVATFSAAKNTKGIFPGKMPLGALQLTQQPLVRVHRPNVCGKANRALALLALRVPCAHEHVQALVPSAWLGLTCPPNIMAQERISARHGNVLRG
jgi:hypothetical protein